MASAPTPQSVALVPTSTGPSGPDRPLEGRVEEYAAWVRDLRQGAAPHALVTDESDPLWRLGRELERLSESVQHRESELRKLFELVHDVETGVRLDDVLDRIFTGFRGVIPFDRIGCAFLSDDRTRVIAYWARSELGALRLSSGFERPMTGSSLETILATGRPRIINDLERYLAAKPDSVATRLIVEEGGRSSLTCPLFVDGRPLGFLFFTSHVPQSYHETHESTFLQIASQVAAILDKSRLYERLIAHNRVLLERTQQLEVVVAHDTLTGVLNRGAIEAALHAMSGRRANDRGFGVIMVDLDHFKAINDTFGHAVGDLALQECVRRLSAVARRKDRIARFGGEEFLIVLDDIGREQLLPAAERFRRNLSDTPFVLAGRPLNVSASFGVAAGETGQSPQDLVARADKALYLAKNSGRNRCELA